MGCPYSAQSGDLRMSVGLATYHPRSAHGQQAWFTVGCATVVCCVLYITLYVAYAPSSTTADDNRLEQPVLQYVLDR